MWTVKLLSADGAVLRTVTRTSAAICQRYARTNWWPSLATNDQRAEIYDSNQTLWARYRAQGAGRRILWERLPIRQPTAVSSPPLVSDPIADPLP